MTDSTRKRALITGITGQDGSYLAELLLEKGYDVWGIVRRASSPNTERIDHIPRQPGDPDARLRLIAGDLSDSSSINQILDSVRPDEVYNLAAQSHVKTSFEVPEYTSDVTALGALRLLEGIHRAGLESRLYQASSSEMFGKVAESPQSETTPFHPRSPYAVSKVFAYHITRNYREAYGMYAVNGILFNHESPRRGEDFVTRKISLAVANIVAGNQDCVSLGNLDAKRDWGFARDYVEAMWRMLQVDKPDDYVVATGETHSVRDFCDRAFAHVGLPLTWRGKEISEEGVGPDGRVLVKVDPEFFRPAEVELLLGDCGKAERDLGWKPEVTFEGLVDLMVEADLEKVGAKIPTPA